jgi:hypothetical protein
VTEAADARRDGLLPMDVVGVEETFGDEVTLLGALQLRWHTRLSGHLERSLLDQPEDLDEAVVAAWHATADDLPGTRLVLDHYRAAPLDEAMLFTLETAAAKERVLLAAMAGRAGSRAEDTVAVGLELEERARATYDWQPATPPASPPEAASVATPRGRGLLARIKAHVAA